MSTTIGRNSKGWKSKRDTNTSACDDGTKGNERNYSKFVSDLLGRLEPEYCDVRKSLQSSSASPERCIS